MPLTLINLSSMLPQNHRKKSKNLTTVLIILWNQTQVIFCQQNQIIHYKHMLKLMTTLKMH